MDHAPSATLLSVLCAALAIGVCARADTELCAIVEASPGRQGCQARLLNAAAAGELVGLVARACPPGTQLTVELPSTGLYQPLVSSLCRSTPVRAGPKMFTCAMRGPSQGSGESRQNSGAALERHPMLDDHPTPGA